MTRLVTGLIIGVLGISMCLLRGWVMRIMLLGIALICVYETYEVMGKKGYRPARAGGYLFPVFSAALCYIKSECDFAPFSVIDPIPLALCLCVMLSFIVIILRGGVDFENAVASVLPLAYPGLPAVMLFLSQYIGGAMLSTIAVALCFTVAWIGDIFAMVFGIRFGKRRLAPALSPKKSVEGSVAGLFGSVLAAVFVPSLAKWLVTNVDALAVYAAPLPPIFVFAMLGLFAGAAAQLGDLTASLVKRWGGVKDYGTIFPGHGGMMDRMDGVLFAAPVCYVFFMLMTL